MTIESLARDVSAMTSAVFRNGVSTDGMCLVAHPALIAGLDANQLLRSIPFPVFLSLAATHDKVTMMRIGDLGDDGWSATWQEVKQ